MVWSESRSLNQAQSKICSNLTVHLRLQTPHLQRWYKWQQPWMRLRSTNARRVSRHHINCFVSMHCITRICSVNSRPKVPVEQQIKDWRWGFVVVVRVVKARPHQNSLSVVNFDGVAVLLPRWENSHCGQRIGCRTVGQRSGFSGLNEIVVSDPVYSVFILVGFGGAAVNA